MIGMIYRARIFARKAHEGQLDDTGQDYFDTHIEPVGKMMRILTDDEELISSAYLHDTLEDTEVTFEMLVKVFSPRVASLVKEVTHEGQKDHYGYYFPHLHSKDGILLKFVDRASNISRMEAWDEDRQDQYLRKSKFWKDGT